MIQRVNREQPFQVLASNFSIGPSNSGYDLEISADGVNYTTLFSVGANVTRMVTGVANGSYYRLGGNTDEDVAINWRTQCNDGQGGGGGGTGTQGPAGIQGPAGENGQNGIDGAQGPQGTEGAQGSVGETGEQGPQGAAGTNGVNGSQGPQGTEGAQGAVGVQGPAGSGGTGGDVNILKSSSGTPANLRGGDVYAVTIPSADTIYGTTWTDSGEQNIGYDRYGNGNPQAIRISTTGARFHWACEEYGTDTYISFENDAITFENDGGWTEISSTHYAFDDWSDLTEGKRIHVEYLNDYFYFYTEDGSQIWIWEVTDNESGNDVFEGEVIPGHGEYYYLYQASKILEPNVKIELGRNASVDGTLDNPSEIITIGDEGSMKISFYDNSNIQGVICDLENYGAYFHLHYDSTANDWTLYDSDEENILINITDGESDSADFGDGNVYLSYSDGVLEAYTDNYKSWQNWDMGDTHESFTAQEFAKVSDLPSETRLLPKNPGAEDMVIYSSDAWRTTSRDAVFIDGLHAFQENWSDDGGKYIITRNGDWNFKWEKLDLSISNLKAVSALPVTTTDGDVIPYVNASGYGIVQAQSGTTGYAWVEGNTEMTGNTQIRVPYTSNDSGYIEFTFENSTDYHNLWWHYDDGNEPHWDGDNVPIDEQVDGEFSGQDGDGETITCVRSGDYLVVTFSSPVVSVNDVYNTEVYIEAVLPTYKEVAFKEDVPTNAVTSNTITTIWKGSQSDYNNLQSYDNNTFYVIIP